MAVEEWWGRMFDGRGRYTIESMPDKSLATIQKLPKVDLAELYGSEGAHASPSVGGILAGVELRRRENWTGRAALSAAVLAIIVSAISR